jgi:hypothetical protein
VSLNIEYDRAREIGKFEWGNIPRSSLTQNIFFGEKLSLWDLERVRFAILLAGQPCQTMEA